jgi:pyruvate kinase
LYAYYLFLNLSSLTTAALLPFFYRWRYYYFSFIRRASDVTNLRQLLAENGGQDIRIIVKIENQEGLQNYQEILQVTDAVMVARGDLGMCV